MDTVVELSKRDGSKLFKKLAEVNEAKKLVRKLPSEEQVMGWIKQAKELPRVVKY